MAEETKEKPKAVMVENVQAPEVYADWWHHVGMSHGNVKITLLSNRVDVPNERIVTVVIGRITMPVAGARAMAEAVLSHLQENAPDPAKPTDPKKLN